MKKRFSELLDKSEAETLNDAVGSMNEEKVSDDTVARIQKRVTGTFPQDGGFRSHKKWIPALGAAACLFVILAVIIGI